MRSRLVRIVADETADNWTDWAAKKAHTRLQRGILGRFAPSTEQIKSMGSVVSTAATNLASLARRSGSEQIESLTVSHASALKDVEGQTLNIGAVYGEHPLIGNSYIKADSLHAHVVREQRSQIIRYFRSAVALKSLTIEIVCSKSGKRYAGGGWKMITAGAGTEGEEEQRRWFTAMYSDPRREPQSDNDNLFWMPYFDEIVAATKNASGGMIETVTSLNTSFGISADAARIANIDGNWISQQSFLVRAEYV